MIRVSLTPHVLEKVTATGILTTVNVRILARCAVGATAPRAQLLKTAHHSADVIGNLKAVSTRAHRAAATSAPHAPHPVRVWEKAAVSGTLIHVMWMRVMFPQSYLYCVMEPIAIPVRIPLPVPLSQIVCGEMTSAIEGVQKALAPHAAISTPAQTTIVLGKRTNAKI